MDYALVASGAVFVAVSVMTDVSPDFWARLLFRALPLLCGIVPIIAGLSGLGII
jgi:hypothetical protein